MNVRLLRGIVLLILALAAPDPAVSDELAERKAIQQQAIELWEAEEFSKLDALAESYRTTKARTSSGLWKLALLYSGLELAFDKSVGSNAQEVAQRWTVLHPTSPMAHLVHARILIARAWSARGPWAAKDVAAANWQVFHQYIEHARSYLDAHKAVASIDPNWYELMIEVATFQSWPEGRLLALLDEATDREPLFYPSYFAAVIYYLPKWHGDAKAIERLARYAVERTHDAEGLGMYARIYWYVSDIEYPDILFKNSLVKWSDMSTGIDDVLAAYPDSWNINNFAKFACIMEDHKKAAELIGRIDEPMEAVWVPIYRFKICKQWADYFERGG